MGTFYDLFKDKNYECVEVYLKDDDVDSYFAGLFEWQNNLIILLDGDVYSEDMEVLSYEEFETNDVKNGLKIVVEEY